MVKVAADSGKATLSTPSERTKEIRGVEAIDVLLHLRHLKPFVVHQSHLNRALLHCSRDEGVLTFGYRVCKKIVKNLMNPLR